DALPISRERLAAAPARGPLEQARRDHAELAAIRAELPGVRERHEKAAAAYTTAANDAADSRAGMEEARTARDAAAALLAERQEVVRRLETERDALRSLSVPAGLDALQQRRAAADAALADATAALARAEDADTAARQRLAAAPARGPLEQALRDRRELERAERERTDAAARAAEADRVAAAAAEAVAEARHRLDHAQERHRLALRADLAASLRPALAVGDPCPVCAQAVATLPPPAEPGDDLGAAEEAVAAATRAHDDARAQEATAISARERARAELERIDADIARLRSALAGVLPGGEPVADDGGLFPVGGVDPADTGGAEPPAPADLEAALADLDRLGRAAEEAAEGVRAARRARDAAAAAVEELRTEVDEAAARLRAARDPPVPFGAPAPSDTDVLAGWTALVDWARAESDARDAALPAARAAVAEAEEQRDTAERAFRAAERAAAERHRDETAAARAEQEARIAVETAQRRVAQLEAALRDAPSDTEAAEALGGLDALEAAVRDADARLRTARAEDRSADRTAVEVASEVKAAWDALRAARDPLVPLGAPAVGGDELLAAWQELTGWAHREAEARAARLADAATATED